MIDLAIDDHPLLDLGWFVTEYPEPIAELPSPQWLTALLASEADAPLSPDDELRTAVRGLLRHGGFKPSGRSKPSCEYLVRAASEGELSSINIAVDTCNAVSLHSGLPISVVDLARTAPPLRVGIAPEGTRYVFNASGQEIDVGKLLCLFDALGACANAVKDAQRTKTGDTTTRVLSVIWGTNAVAGRTAETLSWYRELVARTGASVT